MLINWSLAVGCLVVGALLIVPSVAVGLRRFAEGVSDGAEDLLWLMAAALGGSLVIAGVMAVGFALGWG
jgi:hypothetical protein